MVRRRAIAWGASVALLTALLAGACGGSDFLDRPGAIGFDGGLVDGGMDADLVDGGNAMADAYAADADATVDAPFDAEAGPVFDSGTSPLMESLLTATPFVVLAAATVTNSDSAITTLLEGDVGTTGPSTTGLVGNPFQPTGSIEIQNARAGQALLDVGTAYTSLAGKACPPANDLTGLNLAGMTLSPGVYCFSSSANQSADSTLTFDALGDPNAVWIIQVGTALTVMDRARAVIVGGPSSLGCRIFWTTGTAATLNDNVQYAGNILGSAGASLLTGARVVPGRVFGLTAGVSLLSNTVRAGECQ